jgi:hypothetical protein
MEKESTEVKQDLLEIEVLDKGLEDEEGTRGVCCTSPFLVIYF